LPFSCFCCFAFRCIITSLYYYYYYYYYYLGDACGGAVERIFRIFYDAFAGGAMKWFYDIFFRDVGGSKNPIQLFCQILSPVVTGNSSTHTISIEASCTIIIKGSE